MNKPKRERSKIHPRDIYDDENKNLALTEFRAEAHEIAKEANVRFSSVEISYHSVVDEYCIYIKGKWSGYLDGWRRQGHVRPERFRD